jgi:hypothetical protein
MPPTTTPYLHLTDGTTDLNLLDTTNYSVVRGTWAPTIAPRRRSRLGGLVYEDVVEEIELIVRGSTAAVALSNLAALHALLDQAERWYAGEKVGAVTVRYQPHGSTLADPLRALVLGRPGDDSTLALPPTMNDVGMLFEISGVLLRFVRRGQWLLPAEAAAGAATTHSMPFEGSRAFGTTHLPSSPLNVRLGGFTATSTPVIPESFMLVSTDADRIHLLSSDTATATDFTTYSGGATAANFAGAGVLRYTAAGTSRMTSGAMAISSGFSDEARVVGVIATVRSTSGTTNWTVSATLSGKGVSVETPDYIIPDDFGFLPKVVFLGTVVSERANFTSLVLNVTSDDGNGALDFDIVKLIALDDEYTRVLALDSMTLTGAFASGATAVELTVSARADANRTPFVGMYAPSTGEFVHASYRGDARLAITGTTVYVSWLATGGTVADSWLFTDASSVVVSGQAVDVTRQAAYLSPQ